MAPCYVTPDQRDSVADHHVTNRRSGVSIFLDLKVKKIHTTTIEIVFFQHEMYLRYSTHQRRGYHNTCPRFDAEIVREFAEGRFRGRAPGFGVIARR